MEHKYQKKLKNKIDTSVNNYMSAFFSQSTSKRDLIEFRVGILSLVAGNVFSLFLFYALSRERFILMSFICMGSLLATVIWAQKAGRVTKAHYGVTFAITYIYGLFLFILGDNTRGVIMFGLVYPVLSIYILKSLWGNLLIAVTFVSSLLCDAYLNPLKANRETRSLYICMYLMFWAFGLVMEKTKSFMEGRMQEQQERLAHLASCDHLTKLYNRRSFFETIGAAMGASSSDQRTAAVLMLDVDNFKSINDTYGHSIGDEVLVEAANRLRRSTRSSDISCRWGGEEFLLLAAVQDEDSGRFLAQKLCDAFGKAPFRLRDGRELTITVSVGAVFTENFDPTQMDRIIKAADKNLYCAKESGKNRVHFEVYEPEAKAAGV